MTSKSAFGFTKSPKLLIGLVLVLATADGPRKAVAQPEEPRVVQLYAVSDLLLSLPAHQEFSRLTLPGAARRGSTPFFSPAEGMGGGQGGGQGGQGMGGGGAFGGPAVGEATAMQGLTGNQAFDEETGLDQIRMLIEAIPLRAQVENDVGNIEIFQNLLIVETTAEGHLATTRFLDQLRSALRPARSVDVHAWWIFAPRSEIDAVVAAADTPAAMTGQLPADKVFHRMVSCCQNQSVHIVGGNLRNGIGSVVPVVGSNQVGPANRNWQVAAAESTTALVAAARQSSLPTEVSALPEHVLAQRLARPAPLNGQLQGSGPGNNNFYGSIGYQPTEESFLFGSSLEVSVAELANGAGYEVDFRNLVALPESQNPLPPLPFVNGAELMGKDFVVQQFAATSHLSGGAKVVGGGALQTGKAELGECWLVLMVK